MAVATRVVEKARGKDRWRGHSEKGAAGDSEWEVPERPVAFSSTTWPIPAEKFDEQVQEMVMGKFG